MTLFSFWTLFVMAGCTVACSPGGASTLRSDVTLFALGYMAGAALFLGGWSVEPTAVALFCSVLAGLQLTRGRRTVHAAGLAGAGLILALSSAFLIQHGASVPVAWTVGFLLASLTFALRMRVPDFAPVPVREEALLFVLAAGLLAAAAPEVVAGWQSAMALNASALPSSGEVIPNWVWIGLGVAGVAGAASRWWRRN